MIMRRIYNAIGDFIWSAYWTAVAVIAVGPEQEGE